MPEVMADYIDRLVTVEMSNPGMPRGKTIPLYEAARREAGDQSLTFLAAQGLIEHVHRGDSVLIVTGAGTAPLMPNGEDDGPVGAAVLARLIYWGLGGTPIYICEQHHAAPVVASSEAAGVTVREYDIARHHHLGGAIMAAPTEQPEIEGWARSVLDRTQPTAILSIERLGPNQHGIIHGATGIGGWDPQVDLTPLFTEAAARGIFSVGIGDMGNEIGFGRIVDAVRDIMPHGAKCQCPCGGGMATTVATDVLVVAAVSNWGAYGIEAATSLLLGRADLPHTPAVGREIIRRCLEAGGLEASFCTQRFFVDGIDGESSLSLVQLLREMVRIGLETPDTGPAH